MQDKDSHHRGIEPSAGQPSPTPGRLKPRFLVPFVRDLPGLLGPLLVTVVAAAVALRLLNGLPAYLGSLLAPPPPAPLALTERLEYPTIEAAEQELGVRVSTPSYFPSYIRWPPAAIRGQREPRVVSLRFNSSDGQQVLQIREIFWTSENLPFPVPEPLEVLERREVDVNGAEGRLLVGRGQGTTSVNQLRWRVAGVHLVVTTIYSPEELLRIGRSIHPEEAASRQPSAVSP